MAQCRDLSAEMVLLQTIHQSASGNASPTSPTRSTDADRPNKAPPKTSRSTIERQNEYFSLGLSLVPSGCLVD